MVACGWALVLPDGRVIEDGGLHFKNTSEWLDNVKETYNSLKSEDAETEIS
jgi:3'-phosphoadenosine 5'-phosphosulfate sulfotransferase (PAPS reductase)/FAD synthetase